MNPKIEARIYDNRHAIERLRAHPHLALCHCCQLELDEAAEDVAHPCTARLIQAVRRRTELRGAIL